MSQRRAGARARHQEESLSDSEESDLGSPSNEKRLLNFLAAGDDPRTLSQIKRSRIDLSRRYVFLCPNSLSKHFHALPHQAKDSALLVFRCRRNWLFPDPESVRNARTEARVDCGRSRVDKKSPGASPSSSSGGLSVSHYRGEFTREFLQWVRTKEKEGCVFWFKPEKDLRRLSAFLEEKIDPVNEQPYRPLLLDPQWWRVRFVRTSAKYVSNPALVVAGITGGDDVHIPVMQELIYQSNPSLEPIAKWPHAPLMRFLPRSPGTSTDDFVGQDTKYRGFIDQEKALDGSQLPACVRDHTRITRWPELPRDRLDNLHHLWQVEEASSTRRQTFALHGFSTVGGPLTAR